MRYFNTPNGDIRAIGVGQEKLIKDDWQEMSEAEVHDELNTLSPLQQDVNSKRQALEAARMTAEAEGVIVNGIRYAGDSSNRQAIREALEAATHNEMQSYSRWKDSDGEFHVDHPVADVWSAIYLIASRRGELINHEGELSDQINSILSDDDLDDDQKRHAIAAIEWNFEQ